MTVAEAVAVLRGAGKIRIGWNGSCKEIDPDDELMMDAYGKYQVARIRNYFEVGDFELKISIQPVKVEGM